MKKLSYVLIFGLSIIAGCSSDADNAKKLGFTNPEQMKYLNGLGFKNFDEFKVAHPYVIKSDSTKFAESGLGLTANLLGPKKDSDSGEYYEGPKGVWMLADETGTVSMVGYSCIVDKSKINASIDNIGCDSNSSDLNIF